MMQEKEVRSKRTALLFLLSSPGGNVCRVYYIFYCFIKTEKYLRASIDPFPQFRRSTDPAGAIQDYADECVPVCAYGTDAALCAS